MRYECIMLIELAHFALILAFFVAIAQMVVPMIGAHKGWSGWMAFADPAANSQLVLTGFSFAVLMHAFIVSDFSVALVYANSHTDKPLLYKISGVWGNHEGSMLLWVLILALFGASAVWFGGNLSWPCRQVFRSLFTPLSFLLRTRFCGWRRPR
jgi:cytochrome c-type biogenesis protein CcmF